MMANSARDPYWQAGVRRESIDHSGSQKGHRGRMLEVPYADGAISGEIRREGRRSVLAPEDLESDDRMDQLAQDGVSCSLCHQITKDKLGTRESLVGGFVVDTTRSLGEREEYGPFKIEDGENRIMRTSTGGYKPTEGEHIRQSELCATCHTLITKALGPGGQEIGEFPNRCLIRNGSPANSRTSKAARTAICRWCRKRFAWPMHSEIIREGVSRHVFVGGNFFMQRVLNKYRSDLGVIALPEEFEAAATRTIDHLKTNTAQMSIDQMNVAGRQLQADITVQNLSGHKFPTAYPSRRAWLHVTVKDRNGHVVFESGALNTNGSIQGNDNDADPPRFEPHYTEVNNARPGADLRRHHGRSERMR